MANKRIVRARVNDAMYAELMVLLRKAKQPHETISGTFRRLLENWMFDHQLVYGEVTEAEKDAELKLLEERRKTDDGTSAGNSDGELSDGSSRVLETAADDHVQ